MTHQYNLGGNPVYRVIRATHRPTGISVQLEGHDGYLKMRADVLELLENEVTRRRK